MNGAVIAVVASSTVGNVVASFVLSSTRSALEGSVVDSDDN